MLFCLLSLLKTWYGTLTVYLELSMFLTTSPNNSVSFCTKEQIAAVLVSEKNDIQLQFKQVQVQHEYYDCGVLLLFLQLSYVQGRILVR